MTPPDESRHAWKRWCGGFTGRSGRLWHTHWRVVAAWCVVGIILVTVGSQLLPSKAPEQPPAAKASHAIMVGISGLRWADVDPDVTPALWKLAKSGAVGSLSTESAAKTTCPLDGWLTFSAGALASGATTLDEGRCPKVDDSSIEPSNATANDSDAVVVKDHEDLAEKNLEDFQGAQIGTLSGAVRCSTAVGPGAAYAAARSSGRIDHYREQLPQSQSATKKLLSQCALSVVDLGQLPSGAESRSKTLRHMDTELASVYHAATANTLMMVAGLSNTSHSAHLHAVIASGKGFHNGSLTSVGTGRQGYLRLLDLAPTFVVALERDRPRPFVGTAAGIVPRHENISDTVASLADIDTEAAAQEDALTRLLWVLSLATLLLFVCVTPVLRHARRGPGTVGRKPPTQWTLRIIVYACVALSVTLIAATLVDFIPWWRAGHSMLALLATSFVIVVLLTAVILVIPKRQSPMVIMMVVSLIGMCVVATDIFTGGRLQFGGIAAYSTLNSAGNAGLGPLGYGVFSTSLLMATACAAQTLKRAYRPILIAAAGCAGIFVVGSPYLGDDPSGAVGLTVAICLAAGIATGGWLSFARFAWASFAGLGLLLVLAIADVMRPEEQRGPLGGFVADAFGGNGGGRIRTTLESDVVVIFGNPITLLLIGSVAFTWVVLLRPSGGLTRAFGLYPSVRAGFVGAFVATLLGGILGGNGFLPVGAAAAMTLPLAVIVALRVLIRAQVRDGGGQRTKVLSAGRGESSP